MMNQTDTNHKKTFCILYGIGKKPKRVSTDGGVSKSLILEIPDYLGNCLTCHKKSDRKLNLIAVEHPEYFDFYKRMEKKYPDDKRQIFRGYRTTTGCTGRQNIRFIQMRRMRKRKLF